MASQNWTNADTIAWFTELENNPYRFDLFAVLRYVDAVYTDKPRLGESLKASDDPIHLHQEPSLAFAASTITKYKAGFGGRKDHLYNLAFGMFGPHGALPTHITEFARSRERHFNDATFSRFADVFHHRMMCLFYRAWANCQPVVEMDRPGRNRFNLFVGSLSGMAGDELQNNDQLNLDACLHRSGLLSMGSRPADGLCSLLTDFFNLPFKILQFTGSWLALRPRDQVQIGNMKSATKLGFNTTLGEKVFDAQHKFTISCGPLTRTDFDRLLPNNKPFEELRLLTRHYCGDEFDWDVELWLKEDEVPEFRLGEQGALGWNTWIGDRTKDSGDASVVLVSKGF